MIQVVADRIATFIVKNDDDADFEVLAYGYGLIVSGIVNYTVMIVSAVIFGVILEMLIAIATYITMRLTIGGVHANSRLLCFVTYASALYASIFLSFVVNMSGVAIAALYGFNVALLVLYAPSDTVEQPIVKRHLLRKILGVVFLSLFAAVSMLGWDIRVIANILLFVPTITCVFLHPIVYRIFSCNKSVYCGIKR